MLIVKCHWEPKDTLEVSQLDDDLILVQMEFGDGAEIILTPESAREFAEELLRLAESIDGYSLD